MGAKIDFPDIHIETYQRAKEAVDKVEEWGEVIPLPAMEVPPFPIEVLPDWLRQYAEEVALSTQTPVDLAGCLCLAILSLCCAKKAIVEPKQGWQEPLNIYTLIGMESGSGKSPVFRRLTEPIFDFEDEVNRELEPKIEEAKQEYEMLERKRQKAMGEVINGKPGQKKQEAEREVSECTEAITTFQVPTLVRYIANDVTPEKLAVLMEENGERIALLDSEGGIFETFAGRYNDKTANIELALKAHEGGSVKVDRKNSPPLSLRHPALTIGLTVQPSVIRGLMQKDGFRDRGFLARFLYSMPETKVGYREFNSVGVRESLEEAYQERIKALLNAPIPQRPAVFVFSPEAFMRWSKFWKEVENQLREQQPLHGIQDWGGKYRGAVARLAGLLHIADKLSFEKHTIPLETLERAIRLGEYFKAHTLAVFSEMGLAGNSEACRTILQWIERDRRETFTRRELFRALEYRFHKVDALTDPLTLLEERGYIREKETFRAKTVGRKPSPTYEVNPALLDTNTTQTTKTTESLSTSQNGAKNGHDRLSTKSPESPTKCVSAESGGQIWGGAV